MAVPLVLAAAPAVASAASWAVPAIAAGVGAAGAYFSASGTANAQSAQNKAAAQAAGAQSAQSWFNYLASRGINLQQLVAQFPDLQKTYQEALARGDKRDFNSWLYVALQAAPNHPIWDAIANPAGTAGAANTTLPAWAADAQGNPIQPALFQQLTNAAAGRPNIPAGTPLASVMAELSKNADFAAMPADWKQSIAEQVSANGLDSQLASNASWAAANPDDPGAAMLSKWAQSGGVATGAATTTAPAGPAGTGNNSTLDPAIASLISNSTKTVGSIFDGTLLNEITAGLKPVTDARSAAAAAQLAKINEQRGLSGELLGTELGGIQSVLDARTAGIGGIFDASTAAANQVNEANISKLAELLGVRREAAEQIYNASLGAAGGVRDARTTGAKGIYDAELLRADTYGQSAQDALSRILAGQTAERARRGFTGGSSGSDIVSARLMADYTQRGAGARADAGVGYQGRLSEAGIGYATDTGRAGVGRATTLGAASEQDAIAKLNTAVELARSLGLAGVNKATATAGAGDQNAIAMLNAKVADATRRLSYLTADADIAKANADLANAQQQLDAIIANQNRMTGALSSPFQLAGADLNLKGALNDQKYAELDALLKRIQGFAINPASGPGIVTPTPGAVLNNNQIIGGALTSTGSIIGNTSNNNTLQNLINLLNQGGSTPPAGTPAGTPAAANPYGFTPLFGVDPYAQPAPKV